MEQSYVVLQGKTFSIDLKSMSGSTGYEWALASLPEELILLRVDNLPTAPGIAPVISRFYFGVRSAQNINVEIRFDLVASWKLTETADTYTAKVRIVPSDTGDFSQYGGNVQMDTPFFCPPGYAYAYPYVNPVLKYGYPCSVQDPVLKYGYPCSQDALMKYGYPCSVQDPVLKYGYPCSQDPALKYGYPCQMAEVTKDARPYGYPDAVSGPVNTPFFIQQDPSHMREKYGYPGCC